MVESIIKVMDLDPYAKQMTKNLGASGLFNLAKVCFSCTLFHFVFSSLANSCFLFQALVRMKALQDRCIAREGVIRQLRKHQDIQNKEMDQYKKVVRTLYKKLTAVTKKLK